MNKKIIADRLERRQRNHHLRNAANILQYCWQEDVSKVEAITGVKAAVELLMQYLVEYDKGGE